ncbi:MAG: DUF2207 domain-containing protein [Zhaonellaceae bacterium]
MFKKILKHIGLLIIAFVFITCLPLSQAVAKELTIPKWVVEAKLLENGNLSIAEDITFEFDGQFNGIFREIVLDKTSGVDNIQVKELSGSRSREYTRVKDAENGDMGVYLLEEENNTIRVRIFSPSDDEEKTFRVSYVLKNVAIKYNDIGELYYKFLGAENQTPIGSFRVNITLPQADTYNQVKVFVHGPQNGKISKEDNRTYSLYVEDVPEDTFIEGRLLFPGEFIALSNNIQDKDNLNNILEEEKAFQNKLAQDRERRERLGNLLGQASIWASVLGLGLFAIFLARFRREKNVYQRDDYKPNVLPEDCTPAVASYLTGAILGINTIFATILDLFRKGYIILNKVEDLEENTSEEEFVLTQVKQEDNALLNHEKYFINWLVKIMGNGHSVSTRDIEGYSKHNSINFITLFKGWKSQIKEDAEQKGYYDLSTTKYGVLCLVFAIGLLILGIFSLVYGSIFGWVNLVVAVVLFIYSLTLFYRHSDYGYQQYKRWLEFKKHMQKKIKDLSLKDLIENSADISLIYALSLGVDKKLDRFDCDIAYSNPMYSNNNWFIWYLLFMNNRNSTLHKSFNNSFQGGTGTGGFTGGGFSGGGGGGAGGGGAGGF